MKNVYEDVKIDNDNVESVEDMDTLPQFKQEAKKVRRRVEYDEKGRVRADRSLLWIKALAIFAIAVALSAYVFRTCGAEFLGIVS